MAKAKAIPPWSAAMATSLGLHLAALLCALSDGPHRPRELAIEVEVLPVEADKTPALIPEPAQAALVPAGGAVLGRRRGPAVSRLAISRAVRPATDVASPAETPTLEQAPLPAVTAEPGVIAAPSVIVAKAAPSEGAGPGPDPAPAAPRIGAPKILAPAVGDGLLAINPNDPYFQPAIPQPWRKPGALFLTRLKFCVTAEGAVDKVTVITSSEPALDNAIVEKARLYRFHPYFDQGHPIPFCFYREYRLSIQK